MSNRPSNTSKSGNGKRGWLWMPMSLVLNALAPGGVHLAATAAADRTPEIPHRRSAQTAPPAHRQAHQALSGRQARDPEPAASAAINPLIPRTIDRPVPVPAEMPVSLPGPGREAEAGTGADAGAGEGAAEADAGFVIEKIPDGTREQVPAVVREEPLYAGFAGVTNPALIGSSRVPPRYPELARQAGVQGKVLLQAVIRKDGSVGNIAVLQSAGARLGFDEAAARAVSQWRYKPGLQNGKPVDVTVTILVDFSPPH